MSEEKLAIIKERLLRKIETEKDLIKNQTEYSIIKYREGKIEAFEEALRELE